MHVQVVAAVYTLPTVNTHIKTVGREKFTAPLPVLGLRMYFALTPQWFIRTGSQVFY
jgi:hypothetical protein